MDYIFLIIIFLFGLMIGSFLNCMIWRIHKKETVLGRSYCPSCRAQINWNDNLPILSFIFLRGRCRYCKKKISWQYPAVELATGLLFALAFYENFGFLTFGSPLIFTKQAIMFLRDLFVISIVTIVFIYDLKWYLILDKIVLPASLLVFLLNLYLGFDLWNLVISGIIGGGFFLLQFLVSHGKWIGDGDIRFGLFMGLALGWPGILPALLISYFLGSLIGIGLIIFGKKNLSSKVPMGTFLAVGTIVALFWGERVVEWYLGLSGGG
jgi:prepilin signal peptidase PulO-like enzyme (type II secretory pathway)